MNVFCSPPPSESLMRRAEGLTLRIAVSVSGILVGPFSVGLVLGQQKGQQICWLSTIGRGRWRLKLCQKPLKFNAFLDDRERLRTGPWCPGAESNHRHRDFQSLHDMFERHLRNSQVVEIKIVSM